MDKQLKSVEHLLYPVRMVESKELFPDFEFTPLQEYTVVMDKPDGTKKILNHCSSKYHLVPNRDVVEPLLKFFNNPKIKVVGGERFDSRYNFDFIFEDESFAIKGHSKDIMFPRMRMTNSYDGRVKYSFVMGFFRLICSNGMVLPVKGFEDINKNLKMRHTPSLESYVEPKAIMDMVEDFKGNIKNISKTYNSLTSKKVYNLEERVTQVIEETRFPSRRTEDVIARVLEEQKILSAPKPNDWLVYSGMNYQLNHSEEIKMDAHKREKVDEQVLSFLLEH